MPGTSKTVAQLNTETATNLLDNTTGLITPAALRAVVYDIIASYINLNDLSTTLSLTTTRAQIPSETMLVTTFAISGYTTAGDLAAGDIYTSVGANGSSLNAIQDFSGTWFRLIPQNVLNPGSFGAIGDNTADDNLAIEATIAAGNSTGVPIDGRGLTYKSNSPLSTAIDIAQTNFNNIRLNFSGSSAGTALTITTTLADPNKQGKIHSANAFHNFAMEGPDESANLDAIAYLGLVIAGLPWLVGPTIVGGGIWGFRDQLIIQDGTVAPVWEDMHFGSIVGASTRSILKQTATVNGGEKLLFNNCFLVNATCAIWDQIAGPDAHVIFSNTSIDGMEYYVTGGPAAPGGAKATLKVNQIGGHIETVGSNSDYSIWTSNYICFNSIDIISTPSGTHTWAKLELEGTIIFADVVLDSVTPFPGDYLADGSGRVLAHSTSQQGNTTFPLNAYTGNLIPSFTLPTSAALSAPVLVGGFGWSVSAFGLYETLNPAPSAPAAIGDIAIPANTTVYFDAFAQAGDWCIGAYWLKTTNVFGQLTSVDIYYLDAADNVLAHYGPGAYGPGVAYSSMQYFTSPRFYAPAGTIKFRLQFFQSNTGGAVTYISLPGIYKQ